MLPFEYEYGLDPSLKRLYLNHPIVLSQFQSFLVVFDCQNEQHLYTIISVKSHQ